MLRQALLPVALALFALLATACRSFDEGRALGAVEAAMTSPGAKLVMAQLECDASDAGEGRWTVSCQPVEGAQYQAHPEFEVSEDDLSVRAANGDAERLLRVSERLKGDYLHECTLDEAIAGTLRLTCQK